MEQQHIDTIINALNIVRIQFSTSASPHLNTEQEVERLLTEVIRIDAAIEAVKALRAQAQPPQQPQYVPVEDGFGYECQCSDCVDDEGDESLWRQKIYISGREVGICYVDESDDGHHVYLPDNVRLCRLAAPQQEGNNDTGTD
jgi:hypothetical protein